MTHQRHPDDFYRTPAWATRLILPYLPAEPKVILEPCAGEGAIVRVLRRAFPSSTIYGVEIDPWRCQALRNQQLCDQVWCADIRSFSYIFADLIITNPPFNIIKEIAEHCLMLANDRAGHTALLGKLSFLATNHRYHFHQENASDTKVLAQRPSFTEGGTDRAQEYGWFHFYPGCQRQIEVLRSEEHSQERRAKGRHRIAAT